MVFDADGSKQGEIGRQGEGPGELSSLTMGLYLTEDGALVIPDLGNSRVTFFNADASYSHSFRFDPMAGLALAWGTQGRDRILKEVRPLPSFPGMPARGPKEIGIMSIDHDGTELGMLTTFDLPPAMAMGPGGKMRSRVFAEAPVWTTTPEGHFIVGRSGTYSLEVRDVEGNLLSEISRDVQRKAVTAEVRDQVIRQLEEQMAEMEMPPAAKEMIGDPIFPDSLPVIGRLQNGPNGTILVRRGHGLLDAFSPDGGDPSEEDGPSAYDVHSLQGEYLGILEFPARYSLRAVRGSRVYGVAKDDFDVETVVVYEVSRPGG